MSLNGLDAEKVTAAHEAAVAEPAGWFLLQYTSRDEVDLLASGQDGFLEAREAIAKYEEPSPLFGLVVYKKKKALIKFVPENTSRLLQVRLSVHVQSVIEKFPHDALISLTSAEDLTEAELSSALTQLKSSGSVRSNGSRKQRPLTEIPEDNDEAPQSSSTPQKEQADTTEADIGPESPPDPLLSPASEPFSPARLEHSSLPFATPETETGSFVDSSSLTHSDHALRESHSTPEHAFKAPGVLTRSATYELDDSLTYKPKTKVGPRPSLDHDKKRLVRSSSYRPVAALPAGFKVSTRGTPEAERPNTARSTDKPFIDDMARVAAFSSPVEPPTSRPGSGMSIPSRSTADPESPLSPTTPTITPEKLRLMKALEKRKKSQQAKKAGDVPVSKDDRSRGEDDRPTLHKENSQDTTKNANGVQPKEVATIVKSGMDENVPTDRFLNVSATNKVAATEVLPSNEAKNLEKSNATLDLQTDNAQISNLGHSILEGDAAKEAIDTNELKPSEGPEATNFLVADNNPSTNDDAGPLTNHNRDSIKEGVYLARSGSSSSKSEAEDNPRNEAQAATARSPISASAAFSHLPVQSTKPANVTRVEHSSGRIDQDVIEIPNILENGQPATTSLLDSSTKLDPSNTLETPDIRQEKDVDIDKHTVDDGVGTTFLNLESEVATPATGLEDASNYMHSKDIASAVQAKEASADTKELHKPGDSISTVKDVEAHHQASDSTSTLKPPPLPEGPTRTIVSNVQITTDNGTKLMSSPGSLSKDLKQPPSKVSMDRKRVSAETADTKRSSADSKASKRRPPPLSSSKHDSSDLASLDGDLLYEELQSAKLEEATSMVVARSPATPLFKDPPRSTAHNDDSEVARSSVTLAGNRNSADAMRPKLVHTSSPPVLSRFSSDQSTATVRPGPTAVGETPDSGKGRTFALVKGGSTQPSPTTTNGNSSLGRKSSGVSSLISQRIKAIESAGANGNSSPADRTSIISPQIVSQRKASLTTPPGSAGGSSPSTGRPHQNSSPSNEFVARTFGSVRVSSSHANRQMNGTLERQSSRDSAVGLSQSTSSSRLSSYNSSPNERGSHKTATSYFGVQPSPESAEKPKKSYSFSTTTSPPASASTHSRLSISSKKSNSSQQSGNTERQRSPGRSESSMSSEGDGEKKRNSRGSRLLQRISGLATSPRRNIAEALTDQSIAENTEPKGASKRTSTSKGPSTSSGKWIGRDLGDLNVQFPDNLLWKRRHMEVDSGGNLVLAPASTDKNAKVATKRYYIGQFTPPYIPDQDRAELPHSIILDLYDSSTLQCSCENAQEQAMVLQVLRTAHATFVST